MENDHEPDKFTKRKKVIHTHTTHTHVRHMVQSECKQTKKLRKKREKEKKTFFSYHFECQFLGDGCRLSEMRVSNYKAKKREQTLNLSS